MSSPSDTRRLPAEWEPQSAVMLTWPHENTGWAGMLDEVEAVFFSIAVAIASRQPLLIVCPHRDKATALVASLIEAGVPAPRLLTAISESDDTWARDHGPITVLENGTPRILDFRFNGWGSKYPHGADNAINGNLAQQGLFDPGLLESLDMVLEGGSLDSDGGGSLLTTTSCLLNPQRNPGKSRQDIEQALGRLLGARRLLWLEHGGIEGDDTDGHIDMLARFADRDTILYQSCDEPAYSAFHALQAMHMELQQLLTPDNRPYKLLALPWPLPKFDADGMRMPASYANFLIINTAVLVPTYDDPADALAVTQIQRCFPDREIIPIHCLPLIRQHGSLHCLTMQFPRAVTLRDPDKTEQPEH